MTRPKSTQSWRAFRRRRYTRLDQLWRDLAAIRQLRPVRGAAGTTIGPAFRERLMLVVTAVNRCRYCARFHVQVASHSGITPAEARQLLGGVVDSCPAHEIPALFYAQHWAERERAPDAVARAAIAAQYGPVLTREIERVLGLIWIGNLLGNTFDYLLCRLSRGRLGCE